MDPPADADVYVFDAMFLDYFYSNAWISPIPKASVNNISDFLAYALKGVESGKDLLAIPFLGCANILFYRQGDAALAAATTLTQVNQALGQCSYTSQVPPGPRGLMVDLAGGTTTASFYIDAEQSITNQFPVKLPWTQAEVDPRAIANLHTMLLMSSYWNGTKETAQAYQRSQWFGEGNGRAVVAFTEGMSAMGAAGRSEVAFKVMPMSDTKDSGSLFYSDVAAVHPNAVSRGVGALAIDLVNILTSSSNVINSIGPDSSGTAQYLMPVRESVFAALKASDPIYGQMYDLVQSANPILFQLDNDSRKWLTQMKSTIQSMSRQNYTCGCDYDAGPVWNSSDAATKCPGVCNDHGGWNGQWRTIVPGVDSVCGCNACPAP